MSLTTDPDDPNLRKTRKDGQQETYLISKDIYDAEKKFVRPVRRAYKHNKCGTVTYMNQALAETYAMNPKFYSGTYCVGCSNHYPVSEFVWDGTDEVVGS